MRRFALALLAVCGLSAGAAAANAGDQIFRTASLNGASPAAVTTVAYPGRYYGGYRGGYYGGYRGGYYGGYRGGYYGRGYSYYPRYNYGYRYGSYYRPYYRPYSGYGYGYRPYSYPGFYGYGGFGFSPYYW